jgi:homocysteine S-methyltransferase
MSVAAATMDVTADRRTHVSGVRLRDSYREQADALAQAGVDLIVLEMMTSPDHSVPALEASAETGLPVWLGVSVLPPIGTCIPPLGRPNGSIEAVLKSSIGEPVTAVVVMHSVIESIVPALRLIARHWPGPVGAYPHAGTFQPPNWIFEEVSVVDFVSEAARWIGEGARLVGGCCGIRPAHIRGLRESLAA